MAERSKAIPWAVLAEFEGPEQLLDAVRRLREHGFARVETFTPFPLEGLDEALGFTGIGVPLAFLVGGVAGAALGFGMQAWLNFDFPLWIGGRPRVATPGFMMITFELTVLCSVLAGMATMLLGNRLPKLHHPIFDAKRFTLAEERYFVAILAGPGFDRAQVGMALAALDPVSMTDLTEQPE
jgi:hypothetical protein